MTTTIADKIGSQLPYLRRFARALTGSQSQGDAYVVATLEALVADSELFRRDIEPKAALYSAFLKVWNAVPVNHTAEPVGEERGGVVDRRIESLTPKPRQAFLLAALEEFPAGDIATIMGVSPTEAQSLIDEAGKEISAQISARVMIIEDEPLIALDIEQLVTDIGHTVVGMATTHREATRVAMEVNPGIVLADIHLADGSSGIDAVNEILKKIDVPVIFITAYPERLLTGERPEPAFLVTKPFKPEMVKAIMSQALFFGINAGKQDSRAA